MPDQPEKSSSFLSRSKTLSRAAAVFVIVVGVSVLIGWVFDIARLKSVYGVITMKANTAVTLILAGGFLWGFRTNNYNPFSMFGHLCPGRACFIGLLNLCKHVVCLPFGVC